MIIYYFIENDCLVSFSYGVYLFYIITIFQSTFFDVDTKSAIIFFGCI